MVHLTGFYCNPVCQLSLPACFPNPTAFSVNFNSWTACIYGPSAIDYIVHQNEAKTRKMRTAVQDAPKKKATARQGAMAFCKGAEYEIFRVFCGSELLCRWKQYLVDDMNNAIGTLDVNGSHC